MDDNKTFITEQKRQKTDFERKYLSLQSNRQERRTGYRGLSPVLLERKKELERLQEQLADERKNYEKWMKEHEIRKAEIEEARAKVQEEERQHEIFNRRTQEEIDKMKAEIVKEYDLTQKYTKQLKQVDERQGKLEAKLQELRKELEKLQSDAAFLDNAVSETKFFETPDAVVHRYETLTSSGGVWGAELRDIIENPDQWVTHKAHVNRLKSTLIEKNHKLAFLRDDLERLKQRARYDHVNVIKTAERSNEKEAEIVKIRVAIENMCRRIIHNQLKEGKRGVPTTLPETIEERLAIIEERYLDLQAVTTDPEAVFLTPEEIEATNKKTTEFSPSARGMPSISGLDFQHKPKSDVGSPTSRPRTASAASRKVEFIDS